MTEEKAELLHLDLAVGAVDVAIAGLALPVILILVVKVTGYSVVVEEVAKALVLLALVLPLPQTCWKWGMGALFGLLFGISENFLYLNQLLQQHDRLSFIHRFTLTVPMHVATVLLMFFAAKFGKKYLPGVLS